MRGPPMTTTVKSPCSRPRIESGTDACSIVLRKIMLTLSAAPESPSRMLAATRRPRPSDARGAVMVASERNAPARDVRGAFPLCNHDRAPRRPVAPLSRARESQYADAMDALRSRRRERSSSVFAIVSIAAAALAGGFSAWVMVGAVDPFAIAPVGVGVGALIGTLAVAGALAGGWLTAARTRSLVVRGAGVALGSGTAVGALLAGLGIDATTAAFTTAGIAASLTVSATASWPAGFARVTHDELNAERTGVDPAQESAS